VDLHFELGTLQVNGTKPGGANGAKGLSLPGEPGALYAGNDRKIDDEAEAKTEEPV